MRRLRALLCRLVCPVPARPFPTGRQLGALIDDLLDEVDTVDPARYPCDSTVLADCPGLDADATLTGPRPVIGAADGGDEGLARGVPS